MITETIVIIALLVYIAYQEHGHRQERKKMMEAVMAKDLTEFKQGEMTEKLEPEEEKPPEFMPIEEASEEEFNKAIKKDLGREDA